MTPKSVWRCMDMACNDTAPGGRRTFTGPLQKEVRDTDTLLACPSCGGRRIIFVRDIDYTAEVA